MEFSDLPELQHQFLVALNKQSGPATTSTLAMDDEISWPALEALMSEKYALAYPEPSGTLWTLAKRGRAYLRERGLL